MSGLVRSILLHGVRRPRPAGMTVNVWRTLAITLSNSLNGMPIMPALLERIHPWRTVSRCARFASSSQSHNPALQSRQTTQLQSALPTSPSFHGKPSPWISAYGGSNAVKPKNNFASTGTKAAAIWPTTTPNTAHPSTMNQTDPHMQAHQPNNYGTHSELPPTQPTALYMQVQPPNYKTF